MLKVLIGLVLFSLAGVLGFTTPVYVECADPLPDEFPDLAGKPHYPLIHTFAASRMHHSCRVASFETVLLPVALDVYAILRC